MPRWPLALPLLGYLVSWLSGIGNIIWTLSAIIMLAILLRVRRIRFPRGFGIWLLFLMWACFSIVMVGSPDRALGAAYRMILFFSATIIALYVFNSRQSLTPRYVSGVLTGFLAIITAGGYLAMAVPLFEFNTPLSYLIPNGLAQNELVSEMVVIHATQWNPNAWIATTPRPSAPFLYTNTWGNVYSLLLPVAVAYLIAVWNEKRRRWMVLAIIVASIPPAVSTLNRGMYIGLLVVAFWCAIQALRNGRGIQVLLCVTALSGLVAIWLMSPASKNLFNRLEVTNSSEDRSSLYVATFTKVLESPLFGFGAPRPAAEAWLPSLGTQGQFWTVLFSYGFVGASLFLGFFLYAFLRGTSRIDMLGTVWGGLVLATIVESFYYGMMTGINISLIAAVMLVRPEPAESNRPDLPRKTHPRSAIRRQAASK